MTTTMILSEKFEKELVRFIAWLPTTEYKIKDSFDHSELEWKDSLLTNFKEPGRNKLESYIKEMTKAYFITKGEQEIDDIKFMANEFRTAKVKSPKKQKEITKTQKNKQNTKTQKNKENTKTQKNKENTKTQKNKENVEAFTIVVGDYDTSETFNLDTLDSYTERLTDLFGQPKFFKDEKEFQYEWQVMVGEKIFSIYNWVNDDGKFFEFKDCEWYIGGTEENTVEQVFLKNYIKNTIRVQVQREIQEEMQQEVEQEIQREMQEQEQEQEQEQKQEQEQVDDGIDIELDLIDDENLEINIDDIDFDF
jgi:hypothetical protein